MLWASATDLSFQGGGVLNKACPYNMVPWTERSKLENTFYGHSAVREHNCTVFSYFKRSVHGTILYGHALFNTPPPEKTDP